MRFMRQHNMDVVDYLQSVAEDKEQRPNQLATVMD